MGEQSIFRLIVWKNFTIGLHLYFIKTYKYNEKNKKDIYKRILNIELSLPCLCFEMEIKRKTNNHKWFEFLNLWNVL